MRIHVLYFSFRIVFSLGLNPKIDTPPFAATVALQLYQVNPVHQPWGLSVVSYGW